MSNPHPRWLARCASAAEKRRAFCNDVVAAKWHVIATQRASVPIGQPIRKCAILESTSALVQVTHDFNMSFGPALIKSQAVPKFEAPGDFERVVKELSATGQQTS